MHSPCRLSSDAFRRIPPFPNPRKFHQSFLLRAKDPVISKNNLQKTLEAHRLSNRACLVRKVPTTIPSKSVILPVSPSENLSNHGHESTPSTQETQCSGPVKRVIRECPPPKGASNRRFRVHGVASDCSAAAAAPAAHQHLRWDVDGKGRPEQRPWLDNLSLVGNYCDATSYLDSEILALERYLIPTQREQTNVDQLAHDVAGILGGVVPHPPEVIGSRRTGMAVSHSDIDFILSVSDPETTSDQLRKPSPSRPKMIGVYAALLRKVERVFQQSQVFNGRVYFLGKRFPVLSAVHHLTGLQVQLYCGQGPPSSIGYIQGYHAEYPTLRPLYLTTRLILESRGLFGAHVSSVGSDALLTMILAFLRMNHDRFQHQEALGELLLAILQTYGERTDLQSTGISVDPPGFFNVDTTRDGAELYDSGSIPAYLRGQRSLINLKRTALARRNLPIARRLCIQDPCNYMKDLGRSCTRTAELQAAFADAYSSLRTSIDTWDEGHSPRTQDSILAHALRANFDDFERVRARISYTAGVHS